MCVRMCVCVYLVLIESHSQQSVFCWCSNQKLYTIYNPSQLYLYIAQSTDSDFPISTQMLKHFKNEIEEWRKKKEKEKKIVKDICHR